MFAIFKLKAGARQEVALIHHLSIVGFAITAIIWVLNLFFSTHVPLFIFILFFSVSVGTNILNRLGYNGLATFLGLFLFNLGIYSVASSENPKTGTHMYLGILAFTALVIFGYQRWYYGLMFMFFSKLLYLAVFFLDYSPLPERNFNEREITTLFIISVLAFGITCSYLFYLIIANYYHSERNLRQNELQMRNQNVQLEKANAELDRFVYSASHDLRAPLSSITGIIYLTSKTESVDELRMYLQLIQGRVTVLNKFITDIIQYSRNTRIEVTRETIDLAEIVNEIVEGFRFSEGVERIEFKMLVPTGIKLTTDAVRLRIVLNNLVSNAVRYHDKQKENQFIEIDYRSGNPHLEILVRDNGQGIRPEHVDKIFDMFYKTTSSTGGSGLGLYIAREAATRMSGNISVQSVYGKGSTFSLLLPA